MTVLMKTPMFKVTAPAFCASARVAACGPFNVTKMLLKSMPPTSRPMSGVRRSLTRLLTTPVKATPMMMPTARSTTLPRMMKARNSPIQPGCRRRSGDAVRSLIGLLPLTILGLRLADFLGKCGDFGGGWARGRGFEHAQTPRHCVHESDAVADPGGCNLRPGLRKCSGDPRGDAGTRRHPVEHAERLPPLVAGHRQGRLGRP